MSSTVLLLVPAPSGNVASFANVNPPPLSPTSALITHISRTHSPKALGSYTLEHRLLVDTSSLLPGNTAPKRQTHFLTLASHFSQKTFVGTGATLSHPTHTFGNVDPPPTNGTAEPTKTSPDLAIVTVPSQPDTLFPLMMQKMSPMWAARQAHRVEAGITLGMDNWKIRVGELRISGGPGQGRVRGCLCELEYVGDEEGLERAPDRLADLAKAHLKGLAQDSGVDLGEMRVIAPVPGGNGVSLVRQYMDLLQFTRN